MSDNPASDILIRVKEGGKFTYTHARNNYRRNGALPVLDVAEIKDGARVYVGTWPAGEQFVAAGYGYWNKKRGRLERLVLL